VCRCDSDEKPVPKSSIETRSPRSLSAWSEARVVDRSAIATDSVTSMSTRAASDSAEAKYLAEPARPGDVFQLARGEVDRQQVEVGRVGVRSHSAIWLIASSKPSCRWSDQP